MDNSRTYYAPDTSPTMPTALLGDFWSNGTPMGNRKERRAAAAKSRRAEVKRRRKKRNK